MPIKEKCYPLRRAVWEITLKCCYNCKHCGSRAGRARGDELTTEECVNVARQLAELGCHYVSMIGGEVFMRDDWEEIVYALTSRDVECSIITNGYEVSPELIEKLKKLDINSVAVSVDGPRDLHDKLRAEGSFDKCMAAIDELTKAGIPTSVITTLNADSASRLEEMLVIMKSKHIFAWQLQACSPMGNAANCDIDINFDFGEVLDFVRRCVEDSSIRMSVGVADNIGYYTDDDIRLRGNRSGGYGFRGCHAGITGIGIDSEGNVKGCESLYDDKFIEGNLREKTLREIWEDPDAFAYNRKFTRDMLTGACAECEFGSKCAGGCRSYDWFTTGKLYENHACVHATKIE